VGDSYPLPLITDILGALRKARYYTTLDLASGFHQVPLREEDRQKTAFFNAGRSFRILQHANGYMFGACHVSATNEYGVKWTSRNQGSYLFR